MQSHLIEQVSLAIERNELVLPAMPDLIIKIQKMLDNMNVSITEIVSALASDPAIVAQLIRAANCATYNDKPRVTNITSAVSRLGFKFMRNILIDIAMVKLSRTSHPVMQKHLSAFWSHSREVAVLSYVLAKTQPHLDAEQAMLAGLLHDIGTLPLCLHLEQAEGLTDMSLDAIVRKFRAPIGESLLKSWGFPPEFTEVTFAHEDLFRETGCDRASYADIVTVANMLNKSTVNLVNWDNVAAVKRLWFSPETFRTFFSLFEPEIRQAHDILF